MLLAGNEFMHSQQGNNNGYCQDNEISWLNWDKCSENTQIVRFVQQMIRLRKRHNSLMRRNFLTGRPIEDRILPDISWHGNNVDQPPNWQDPETRLLAFTLAGVRDDEPDLHVILNMSDIKYPMDLPKVPNKTWCLAVDTALTSPKDIIAPEHQVVVDKHHYQVDSHSVVVFESITEEAASQKSQGILDKITGIKTL